MDQLLISNKIIKSYINLAKDSPLYHITINPKSVNHIEELRFKTGVYIRSLMKFYTYKFKPIKYLFVIEYSGVISKGVSESIERRGEHVHLILSTDLKIEELQSMFFINFPGLSNPKFERIDNRNDMKTFYNYLIKQEKYFTKESVRTNIK